MIRRRTFGVPSGEGGMEDANEQELERLIKEDGRFFDKAYADKDGDETQPLSASFDLKEETDKNNEEQGLEPVSSSGLPTSVVENEENKESEEQTYEGEQEPPEAEDNQEQASQPPSQNRGRRGGVYVAVIAICLFLSVALLVLNSLKTDELPSDENTVENTDTTSDIFTDTEQNFLTTAEQIYSAQKNSSVTVCLYLEDGKEYRSGTVVLDGGCVVTVCENISEAERIEIVSAEGKSYTAEVMGYDVTADIALLKCEGEGLTPVWSEGANSLGAGARLYAIGTASDARFGGSLFEGVVSFEERTVEIFSSDGSTRRAVTVGVGGFSCDTLRGCPVYDESGRAVAMVWGDADASVGLVIPMERVIAVAEFYRNGEIPDRETLACIAYGAPSLGIRGENYSENGTVGVIIRDFVSPVCDAALKLRKDDVIVQINDIPIKDTQTVKQTVYAYRAGDTVEIHVARDSQLLSFFVELGG